MDDDLPDLDAITSGSITVDGGTLVLAGDVDFALVNAWDAPRRPPGTSSASTPSG